MSRGIQRTGLIGSSIPKKKVVEDGETLHPTSEAVEYTKSPITIGTPTDISGMKVTVLETEKKPKKPKPLAFNGKLPQKKEQKPEEQKRNLKWAHDYRISDAMIKDPKYQLDDGTPNIVLIAHETGFKKHLLHRRYGTQDKRGRKPVYDYSVVNELVKQKQYQMKNGKPSHKKLSEATGIPANAIACYLFRQEVKQ